MKKWLIVALVFAAVFPIFIDQLYGKGLLSMLYHNYFPAEVWFSFLGSYLPAMLIGILTIYQQKMIKDQDKRYRDLMEQYRYTPDRNATVFRHSPSNNSIGEWTYYEFKSSLGAEKDIEEFHEEWMKGYILQCSIHKTGNIGIKSFNCTKVEWTINSELPYQVDSSAKIKTICRSVGNARYVTSIFWSFYDDDDSIAKEVALCMNNYYRKSSDYYTSNILLEVEIIDDKNNSINLCMNFKMQQNIHEANPYMLVSVEEHYYPV